MAVLGFCLPSPLPRTPEMPLLCALTPSLLCQAEPSSPRAASSLPRHSLPPAPASSLAIFMEHHRPETLAEPNTSERPPVGRQLFPGPLNRKRGRSEHVLCLQAELATAKPLAPQGATGGSVSLRKASDCLGPGPCQLCSNSKETCSRRVAEEKVGPMPSSQRNCCRTLPWDLGVLSGGKWGQDQSGRSPQGQRLGFPEEEGAH